LERDLRSVIRGDVECDPVTRRLYATDAGLTQMEPLGVVCPRDTKDVARLVAYAAENRMPLVPRGMGSGLNGGAVGRGIQVDFTRYMDSIIELASDASWVRVQPGVVLSALNAAVRPLGVFFPPDPSSENHCSIGGMIGTNASGARTVAYGATKDHVLELELVLSDGSVCRVKDVTAGTALGGGTDAAVPGLTASLQGNRLAADAFSSVLAQLSSRRAEIVAGLPEVVKNSCGYRLETLLDQLAASEGDPDLPLSLQTIFVGSEGTLGLVTEATLRLVPLPDERGIAMAYFPSIHAAGEAIPGLLALEPTAVEIMDSNFLTLVRDNDSRVDSILPRGANTAVLVEFEASTQQELDERFAALSHHVDSCDSLRTVRASGTEQTELLWRVRKSAVPLMQQAPGRRQPQPFIEDLAIAPLKIAGCIDFLQKLFEREGVQAVTVGHVGDGNLHTRPMLDPRDPDDGLVMQRIYDEVAGYILEHRGTLSGEHGDGLVHTPRLEAMYGPEIYGVFEAIKKAFDPQNVLNPGKKVGPQHPGHVLSGDTRYGPLYTTSPQDPLLVFAQRGFENEIERCHGCAACKSVISTTMCPTYKATSREHASPRAKANVLRAVISGALREGVKADRLIKQVTDYCIGCGMCARECPSRVDIPKLVLEAKSRYRQRHKASRVDFVLSRAEDVARAGQALTPLSNRLSDWLPTRLLAQFLFGVDRRRPMAPFAQRTLHRSLAELSPRSEPSGASRVAAYFYDLFVDYYDPALGLAVMKILAAHGVEVVLPEQKSSGIPEMLYGYVERARRIAEANVRGVLPHIQEGAALVSAEPTASYAFKVHYPDYLDDPSCALVAEATFDLAEYLVRIRGESPDLVPTAKWKAPRLRVAYHQPCHSKAQGIGNPYLELLAEIPGVEVTDLAAGCCGMAGTFGMKRGTYDFSMAVGKPLFDRVGQVKPDVLVSDCSTCRMQLTHATGLPTSHPVTLLAEAYRP